MVGGRERGSMKGGEDVGLRRKCDSLGSHWRGIRRARVLHVARVRPNYHHIQTLRWDVNCHAVGPGLVLDHARHSTGNRNRARLKNHYHLQLKGRAKRSGLHPASASYGNC